MRLSSANLRLLMDVMFSVSNEVNVKVDGEYLVAEDIDSARVMYVQVKVPFSGGDTIGGEVGFDVGKLKRLLPKSGDVEVEKNGGMLIFSSDKKTVKTRVIELDKKPFKVPELEFTSSGVMGVDEFVEIVYDAAVISDSVRFENGKVSSVGATESVEMEMSSTGEGTGLYSAIYLEAVANILKKYFKESVVSIRIGDNIPIEVTVERDDGARCMWLIAPRIEGMV